MNEMNNTTIAYTWSNFFKDYDDMVFRMWLKTEADERATYVKVVKAIDIKNDILLGVAEVNDEGEYDKYIEFYKLSEINIAWSEKDNMRG